MSAKIPTIQSRWESYRDACFPDGLPAQQDKELRQAFFSAAFSVLELMRDELALLSDDDGVIALEGLHQEARRVCTEYLLSNFKRNN